MKTGPSIISVINSHSSMRHNNLNLRKPMSFLIPCSDSDPALKQFDTTCERECDLNCIWFQQPNVYIRDAKQHILCVIF